MNFFSLKRGGAVGSSLVSYARGRWFESVLRNKVVVSHNSFRFLVILRRWAVCENGSLSCFLYTTINNHPSKG